MEITATDIKIVSEAESYFPEDLYEDNNGLHIVHATWVNEADGTVHIEDLSIEKEQ